MTCAKAVAGPAVTFARQYGAILALEPASRTLLCLSAGLVAGWWVYVPVHELLHAAGCLLAGGTVSRLEIQPLYGGRLLAQVFPFVSAGGDYAGRLSGFDIRGSDWIYFVTVYFPYLPSLGGLWLTETAVARRFAALFGFALPCALAPLVSLTGDFLEIGSLALFQVWPGPGGTHRQLISDDLFRLIAEEGARPGSAGAGPAGVAFIGLSLAAGAVAAWATLVAADRVRALLPPAAARRGRA